jgi:hypothetical protein
VLGGRVSALSANVIRTALSALSVRCGKVTRYGYTCTGSHKFKAAATASPRLLRTTPQRRRRGCNGRLQIRFHLDTAVTGVHGKKSASLRSKRTRCPGCSAWAREPCASSRSTLTDPCDTADRRDQSHPDAPAKVSGSRGDIDEMRGPSADDSYLTVSVKGKTPPVVRPDPQGGGDFHELSHGFC